MLKSALNVRAPTRTASVGGYHGSPTLTGFREKWPPLGRNLLSCHSESLPLNFCVAPYGNSGKYMIQDFI